IGDRVKLAVGGAAGRDTVEARATGINPAGVPDGDRRLGCAVGEAGVADVQRTGGDMIRDELRAGPGAASVRGDAHAAHRNVVQILEDLEQHAVLRVRAADVDVVERGLTGRRRVVRPAQL